ncbi:MAG TPA: hypothetical protein HPP87_11905 [Planctomycetes bacterium]|nr:hypothetical protein [Planctomycetota bacterium]
MKTILIQKRALIVGTLLTTLFSQLILYSVSYGNNGSIRPMPEAEYAEFLDAAEAFTQANYERISTLQGEISIQEDNYLYGETCRRLQISEDDPAYSSNSIRRRITNSVEKFAVDVRNNKLYTELTFPNVKYKALDLDRDVTVKEKYSSVISIVTSDEYLTYEPGLTYGYEKKTNGKWVGRKAFRWPVKRVKGEQWGHVRDPRKYFFNGHRAIWEELSALRNHITNPSPDIPEGKEPQISITTEEIGENTKFQIKGGFHGSEDCANCENNFVYIIMTLDNSVGLNLVRREVTRKNGETLQTLDITYEKIDDVYVPKTIHYMIFLSSDGKIRFDSQITFTKSVLNAPIPTETFEYTNLGLKDGDIFSDKIANKEFQYEAATKKLKPVEK